MIEWIILDAEDMDRTAKDTRHGGGEGVASGSNSYEGLGYGIGTGKGTGDV